MQDHAVEEYFTHSLLMYPELDIVANPKYVFCLCTRKSIKRFQCMHDIYVFIYLYVQLYSSLLIVQTHCLKKQPLLIYFFYVQSAPGKWPPAI